MIDRGRPLRIGYVLTNLHPGGAERQMLMLAEGLPRERFTPEIICTSDLGPYAHRARANGIRLHTLGRSSRTESGSIRRRVRRSSKSLSLLRLIRSRRFDIVDAWLYPSYLFVALSRHLTGVGAVVSGRRNLHNLHPPFGPVSGRLNDAANWLTDAVVANSEAVARDAIDHEGLDPAKLHIIRNGVSVPEPPAPRDVEVTRRGLGATPDDVVIGCVANYLPVKRLDVLIDAVATIVPERPIKVILVGEGPTRPELEDRIERLGLGDRIRLHGRALDPSALYWAFDAVALPSDSEGLPNVLLEAAAAGRPLVATSVGGSPEICVNGESGILVGRGDVAAMAAALARIIDDEDLRVRLGRGARQRAAGEFGISRFVDEFSSLYLSLRR